MSTKTDLKEAPIKDFEVLSAAGQHAIAAFEAEVSKPFHGFNHYNPHADANFNLTNLEKIIEEEYNCKLAAIYGNYIPLGCYYRDKDLARALDLYRADKTWWGEEERPYLLGMYYFSRKNYKKAIHLLKDVFEREKGLTGKVYKIKEPFIECFQQLIGNNFLKGNNYGRYLFDYICSFTKIYAVGCDVEPSAIPNFNLLTSNIQSSLDYGNRLYRQGLEWERQQNYQKAIEFFCLAALYLYFKSSSSSGPLNNLIHCYSNGLGVNRNEKTAEQLKKLQEQYGKDKTLRIFQLTRDIPVKVTNLTLGHLFIQSDKEAEREQAFKHYQSAAKQKDDASNEGNFFLGLCYLHSIGTKQNFEQAVHHLKIAATKGNLADARKVLAACYEWGLGVTENRIIAQQIRQGKKLTGDLLDSKPSTSPSSLPTSSISSTSRDQTSDQKEEEKSSYRMAFLGKKVLVKINSERDEDKKKTKQFLTEENFKEAATLLKLALLKGDLSATLQLGEFYEQGQGVVKNARQAKLLFRVAYEHGLPEAKSDYQGESVSSFRRTDTERQWLYGYLQLLIDANWLLAEEAIFSAAKTHYQEGELLRDKKDKDANLKATECFNKAFEKAVEDGTDDQTLYLLGMRFLKIPDYSKAVRCLQNAAANGHRAALASLIYCYQGGLGVKQDQTKADSLEDLSKTEHWSDAENFALLNLTKEDIHPAETFLNLAHHLFLQEKNAVGAYQQAANRGSAKAHYYLALLYLHGKEVERDFSQAANHLRQAIIKGPYQPAKDILAHCSQWQIGIEGNRQLKEIWDLPQEGTFSNLGVKMQSRWRFSTLNTEKEIEISSPYVSTPDKESTDLDIKRSTVTTSTTESSVVIHEPVSSQNESATNKTTTTIWHSFSNFWKSSTNSIPLSPPPSSNNNEKESKEESSHTPLVVDTSHSINQDPKTRERIDPPSVIIPPSSSSSSSLPLRNQNQQPSNFAEVEITEDLTVDASNSINSLPPS